MNESELLYQKELLQWEKQLKAARNLLKSHPLVNEKSSIIQSTLSLLSFETKWRSVGKFSKYLIALQIAFQGAEETPEKGGIIGPNLSKFQNEIQKLTLPSHEILKGVKEILSELLFLVSIITLYLTREVLGKAIDNMPQSDLVAAEKGVAFLKELGQLFIVGSQTIRSLFLSITLRLGLSEKDQKHVSELAIFKILVLLITLNEMESRKNEDLTDRLMPFFIQPIQSLRECLGESVDKGILDQTQALNIENQVSVIYHAALNKDREALQQGIEKTLQAWDIPYEEFKSDIRRLIDFCDLIDFHLAQVSQTIRTPRAHVDQAA